MKPSDEEKRAEFSSATKKIVKERAGFICSNPTCRLMTVGPSDSEEDKVVLIGQVAHILPAKKNGPRDIPNFDPLERSNIDNAIYLCGSCAGMVDKNNGSDYPVTTLKSWREGHFKWMKENLNKQLSSKNESLLIFNQGNVVYGSQTINYNLHSAEAEGDRTTEHDIKIFNSLSMLCDEEKFTLLVRKIKDSHRIFCSEMDLIDDIIAFFNKAGNSFLNVEIGSKVKPLLAGLDDLSSMLGNHFDMYPYHQSREDYIIELEPRAFHWTGVVVSHEEKAEGMRLSQILRTLCERIDEKFREFRMSVKKNLFI